MFFLRYKVFLFGLCCESRLKIYQKPFTQEDFEGIATIKKINRVYKTHIEAEVEFEGELGETYFRTIVTDIDKI